MTPVIKVTQVLTPLSRAESLNIDDAVTRSMLDKVMTRSDGHLPDDNLMTRPDGHGPGPSQH